MGCMSINPCTAVCGLNTRWELDCHQYFRQRGKEGKRVYLSLPACYWLVGVIRKPRSLIRLRCVLLKRKSPGLCLKPDNLLRLYSRALSVSRSISLSHLLLSLSLSFSFAISLFLLSLFLLQDIRLKKLLDERESFLDQAGAMVPQTAERTDCLQIKKLKGQLQDRPLRNDSPENAVNEEMENGTDQQRDSSRQISDLKFKLTKSTQEITALEQNIIRLESQVTRYKSSSENAEKVEDELKAEKRKLQRELRTALDKIGEIEVSNSHLVKRLEKMKANRSAMLSQQ